MAPQLSGEPREEQSGHQWTPANPKKHSLPHPRLRNLDAQLQQPNKRCTELYSKVGGGNDQMNSALPALGPKLKSTFEFKNNQYCCLASL